MSTVEATAGAASAGQERVSWLRRLLLSEYLVLLLTVLYVAVMALLAPEILAAAVAREAPLSSSLQSRIERAMGPMAWQRFCAVSQQTAQNWLEKLRAVSQEVPSPKVVVTRSEPDGFSWLIVDDNKNSVFAWARHAPDANPVVVVSNFTPVPRGDYRVPMPKAGRWREVHAICALLRRTASADRDACVG